MQATSSRGWCSPSLRQSRSRGMGDERGGVDAVLGLHAQEGVSVYNPRTDGRRVDRVGVHAGIRWRGRDSHHHHWCQQLRPVCGYDRLVSPGAGITSGSYSACANSEHGRSGVLAGTNADPNTHASAGFLAGAVNHAGSHAYTRAGGHAGNKPDAGAYVGTSGVGSVRAFGWAGGNADPGAANTVRHRQGVWKSAVGSAAGWRLGTNGRAGSQSCFVRFGRREIRRDAVVVRRNDNAGAGGDDSRRQHVLREEAAKAILPRNSAEKPRVQ